MKINKVVVLLLSFFFIVISQGQLGANAANDLSSPSRLSIDAQAYKSINAAIADPANQGKTIDVTSPLSVTSSFVTPANLAIRVMNGGLINHGSFSIQFNGPFSAGIHPAFSGTGAITFGPGSVEHVLPQWWGAHSENADDTLAFQAAANSLRSLGGKIYVPNGNYRISFLQLFSNISLEGESWSTRIKQKINTRNRYPEADGMITVNQLDSDCDANVSHNKRNITIRNITLEGNVVESGFNEIMHLVAMQAVSDVFIDRVNFIAPQGDAIAIFSGSSAALERHSERITITNSHFDGVNYDNRQGISLYDVNGALIENNYFTRLTRANMPGAIDLEGRWFDYSIIKNVKIKGNMFKDIGVNGTKPGVIAYFYGQDSLLVPHEGFIIEDNLFDNSSGIYLGAKVNVTASSTPHRFSIKNNTFSNINGQMDIYAMNGVTIENNTFRDSLNALRLGMGYPNYNITIKNNVFKNMGTSPSGYGYALELYGHGGLDIEGNYFINVGRSDATQGIAVAATSGTYSVKRLNMRDNVTISTNNRTKYFLAGSETVEKTSSIFKNNVILNSETGAAAFSADGTLSGLNADNFTAGFDVYSTDTPPSTFRLGVTTFLAYGPGLPSKEGLGSITTYRLDVRGAVGWTTVHQVARAESGRNATFIWQRFSNADGTGWGPWQKFEGISR